jgi:hypothetical protein
MAMASPLELGHAAPTSDLELRSRLFANPETDLCWRARARGDLERGPAVWGGGGMHAGESGGADAARPRGALGLAELWKRTAPSPTERILRPPALRSFSGGALEMPPGACSGSGT